MAWKYDFMLGDLVWSIDKGEIVDGIISFGEYIESDLDVSMGSRDNDLSVIDQGQRISEV